MKVSIVGVTGYSGLELIRYIQNHPFIQLASVHSHSMNKKSISEIQPHMLGILEKELEAFDSERIMKKSDLVFFATPSGIAKDLAEPFIQANFPVIDLSGDFRLKVEGAYEKWYGKQAAKLENIRQFDYGLAEFRQNRKAIWISNPGCYATVTELSLAPLLLKGWIDNDSLIIDGKSGLSGAGKSLSQASHFVEANENMSVYKVNSHQHIPEILQQFQVWQPDISAIQFSTSLIPVNRGIFLTAYAKAKRPLEEEQLVELYQEVYEKHPFVRIQPKGSYPTLKQVLASNYCDIGLAYNKQTNIISIVAAIDNLGKGAAGQAIQNANILGGYAETAGLNTIPVFP